MSTDRVPASFRDPSGFLFRRDHIVYRQVNPSFGPDYDRMMESGFYDAAVGAGYLVAHEEVPPESLGAEGAYRVLKPEQIPFISYPYEWSFSQLKDAALLTLTLHQKALDFGLWLKDASAYNVQFHRGSPLFIDSLSFEAYPEGQPWVAYRQFCQHFLAPLALMGHRHADLGRLLRIYTDGVPLDLASMLLPWRTRFNFGLLTHVHAHARMLRKHADSGSSAEKARSRVIGRTAMLGLIDHLRSTVRRLEAPSTDTEWGDYYEDTNYSDTARRHKEALVGEFIDSVAPGCVWDLGANTGIFSRLAAARGIRTVALDGDPVAVEKNYRETRQKGETLLLPLVIDLMNPSSDLGWDGSERMSLNARGPADLLMALALVHHLAIGNNVPLGRISVFFRRLGNALIVEFVPKSDSQVQRLLATRRDIFTDYTQEAFEEALSQHFELRRRERVAESERVLYLWEGRPGVSQR